MMHMKEKTSVLFVEDNKLAQKIGVIILEQCDCQVDAVTSGEMALQYARRKSYNIIFMDLGLPDMDGIEVIQQIKKMQLNKHVPIIALTAHSDKEYISQSYEVGASEFLVKPLSDQIAKNILNKYLSDLA
jgi:two-component system, OmpR family, aerobic respiration control sensor histidine kinase ArcB